MTREPVLPASRAAIFAAVCLSLGVEAHRFMSSTAIPPWAIVLGAGSFYAVARLAASRERGLVEITLLMGVLQVVLHLLFTYAQDIATTAECCVGMSPSSSMPMPAGSSMSMPGMSMPMGGSGGGMRMTPGMLAGHVLAAVVCAWWLRRGEAAVHAFAREAVERVAVHFAPPCLILVLPVRDRARIMLRVEPIALALRSQRLRTSLALRGPPLPPSFA